MSLLAKTVLNLIYIQKKRSATGLHITTNDSTILLKLIARFDRNK